MVDALLNFALLNKIILWNLCLIKINDFVGFTISFFNKIKKSLDLNIRVKIFSSIKLFSTQQSFLN